MTNANVLERRRKIKKLLVLGLKPYQISERLNLPERTLTRDVTAIREELSGQYARTGQAGIAHFLMQMDEVLKEAWRKFNSTDRDETGRPIVEEREKAKYLEIIMKTTNSHIDRLQQWGILPKELGRLQTTSEIINYGDFAAAYERFLAKRGINEPDREQGDKGTG